MIELLTEKPATVSEIAGNFDVSLVAVSKHLKILAECGLIRITLIGRERHCEATLGKLQEVSEWVASYEIFWKKRLSRLKYMPASLRASMFSRLVVEPITAYPSLANAVPRRLPNQPQPKILTVCLDIVH